MSVTDTSVRRIVGETELSEQNMDEIEGLLEGYLQEDMSRSKAVKETFLEVVEEYPSVNVADLWNYGLYRNYVSLVGDNEQSAQQSWRQVSGSAFEHFVVSYYNERLPRYLRMVHITDTEVGDVISSATGESPHDVADAVLLGRYDDEWHMFAGVNTLTSLKGRLQGYANRSDSLRKAGLESVVVTLDAHIPTDSIRSKGELSSNSSATDLVEEYAMFDGLYSFNNETEETGDSASAPISQVGETRFNDDFVEDVTGAWEEFVAPLKETRSLRVS